MKTLSRRLLLILAILFIAVAAVQYGRQRSADRRLRQQEWEKASRRLSQAELRRENDFWAAEKFTVSRTARLFREALTATASGTEAAAADQPAAAAAAVAPQPPADPLRQSMGEGEAGLGFMVPGAAALPLQAQSLAAALPRLQGYRDSLGATVASVFFISKDGWLAVLPARKAMALHAGHRFATDPLLANAMPEKNPRREPRFTPPRLEEALGRWVISVSVPVLTEGGFQGVAGHDLALEPLLARLGSEAGREDFSRFIMDDAFGVILHRDLAPLLTRAGFNPGPGFDLASRVEDRGDSQAITAIRRQRSFAAESRLRLDGSPALLLTARQPDTGWQIVHLLRPPPAPAAGLAPLLDALPLLAGLALLFVLLRLALVGPLARLGEGLLRQGPADAAARPARRPPAPARLFPEVGRIHAEMAGLISRLQTQVGEGRETRAALDALFRASPSLILSLDARLRPVALNDYALRRLQIGRDNMAGLRASRFFTRAFIREIAAELRQQDQVSGRETTMTLPSGEKIDVSLSLARQRDSRGQARGYLAVIHDISKRRKAELDLKNQILFSRQIFQSIPEMIIIVDRRLRVTFINRRARDVIQAGAAVIGQNINVILARSSLESGFDEMVRGVLEGGRSVHRINTLNPILEEENYVDLIVEPLRSGELIIGGIIMLRDISEWRSLTGQLRSLQGFMQKLINASPYAVISLNEHGLITTWNSAAERILGVAFANAFGKNLYDLLPLFEKYKDAINEVMILKKTVYLNDEQVFIGEEDFKVANFTFYPVTAEQNGVVIHMEDVSALKKLESSLIHAQKMESLGLLTSHIIHDFNNLLSGIMGYASLLEKKIADNPKVQKYVSTIITSSERASTLINQLLNFSRKKMAEKEVLNINDLIKEALDFLAMNLKSINLDIQLYQSQILLQADKTKISQILINLLVNARDALEGVERPIIRLRTDRVEISGQNDLLDGPYALVEISDNGGGINPENQKKIFEPFFTTKGQGRGTGLGLAIVREIIHDYNGRIELNSQVGRGTVFSILLPVFEQPLAAPAPREEALPETPLEGLVLLIDDEEVVREIGADMLKTLGLKCLTAVNGNEGIEAFKKNPDIALVILDVEMPGISGEKVFHILRELRPDIKILIASGYGRDYLESEVFKSKIAYFMPKPFKTEQLSYQVTRLLRGGDA
ncbi:MAG TPA: PAS domain-containing protein [Candidatus Aminicenantes bacterium]|nr:PAS domain-containing protein [Candidatus Aminicenantes bacterium]